MKKAKPPCILYMSSYPPRECGIATFTQDLVNSIDKEFSPAIKSKILAINDNGTSLYNYPKKVSMQMHETEMEDYINRAYDINKSSDIKLVNLQHEYGLFGGEQGEFLIPFLEMLKKPIVTTMHTVLPEPGEKMQKIGSFIAKKSEKVIVMNETAKNILIEKYNVSKNKIAIIPHGVHNISFPSKSRTKKALNLNGRIIISTFGMISKDKGIEYAIQALPSIVKKYPNVLYLVLGATHPVVLKHEGEKYRNKLKKLVTDLGLEENVRFYNKYLSLKELIEFLKATDIYVYPMLSKEQASSGSLSYALSCACPVVATKSQYAKSIIKNNQGILVDFKNSEQIEKAFHDMLSDRKMLKEMTKNAYFFSRHMTWSNVAINYFNTFNSFAKIVPTHKGKLPIINLGHIKNLTDDFGMIQFANHTKPDIHSGYCQDDNVRILLACAMLYEQKPTNEVLSLIKKYFNFIKFVQKSSGKFYNVLSYQRIFIDEGESEDAFGRTIWTLGYIIKSKKIPNDIRTEAIKVFIKAKPHISKLKSYRAIAFAIIGLSHIAESDVRLGEKALINSLTQNHLKGYYQQIKQSTETDQWNWFENCLTYSNFKMPESLFRAYKITKKQEYLDVAENTMDFLLKISFEKNYLEPVGQNGWYFRGGKRSYFDQQPEDASSAVEALCTAYEITKKEKYKDLAVKSFNWFLGNNHLMQMIYDEATGGCFDGLGEHSINFNQGAESTISYLLARLTVEKIY